MKPIWVSSWVLASAVPRWRFEVCHLLGLDVVCESDALTYLGTLYEPTARMREMAANGEKYYG